MLNAFNLSINTHTEYIIYTFHGVCVPSAVWNEYFAIDMHS